MICSRRRFMAGALAAGLAGAVIRPEAAFASAAPLIIPVVGGSPVDEVFLAGLRRVAPISSPVVAAEIDPSTLEGWIAGMAGTCIVGLLDEGRQTLLDEAARLAKARVMCNGNHTFTLGDAGGSTHRFVASPRAHGIGAALAQGLQVGKAGFAVHETAVGGEVARGTVARLDSANGWPGMVGQALALVAIGSWTPGSPHEESLYGATAPTGPRRGMVSFAIQL